VVDDEAPPADDAGGEPAFILAEGVPYVRGWVAADRAAQVLRAELRACGLAERVAYVRAEVTAAGLGMVDLGRVTPAVAEVLARLLAQAREGREGGLPGDAAPGQRWRAPPLWGCTASPYDRSNCPRSRWAAERTGTAVRENRIAPSSIRP
jgi:hypothetical protein